MYNPKVSIVIPVYNGANYVGEAIESALEQTYENKEIIVVNDGSTDDGATERVVLSYGDTIRYFSKENGGVSSALNCGIRNATGEWISWLSHDDLYTTDKVAVQVADVEKLKNVGVDVQRTLFYCAGALMNEKRELLRKNTVLLEEGLYEAADYLKEYYRGQGIGGCGLLMPKSMFEEVGYFEESMRYMQDAYMWQKAFIAGYGIYVNRKVMSYTRVHNMQTSTTGKKYLVIDREKVGRYLEVHLDGIKAQDGTDILKEYMFFCARKDNPNIAKSIYNKLLGQKRLNVFEVLRYFGLFLYGKLRKLLVKVYYRVRFGTKR